MVWSQETESERPPLSAILPGLYLGAERDVTQELLASLGISYVLSVTRCSPQPSFLPDSRYLRIPIDDSLWDDMLPWIPQALHFIDAAISSGGSVLVHCAAGISRSPALAVAYVMYRLGMDLDHAYRFVKERRPSISPNFNFLGQLQHFHGTLNQKPPGGDLLIQQLDNQLSSGSGGVSRTSAEEEQTRRQNLYHANDTLQRRLLSDGSVPLSGKLRTLRLTVNQNQQELQIPRQLPASNPCEPVKAAAKPTQLQLPSGSALQEKRKSLTLSLTPLVPPTPSPGGSSQKAGDPASYKNAYNMEHSKNSRTQVEEQGLLSQVSFTLNKLLGWGERLLLGGVFVQPALPYRC